MFDGYKTRWWNKDHYEYTEHKPDHVGLTQLLAFWPAVIDNELIDKFYKYEDPKGFPRHELEWVYADLLYTFAPRPSTTTSVGLKVRELWYQDWSLLHIRKIYYGVWRDLILEVLKHDWLVERISNDILLPPEGQAILKIFQNKYSEVEEEDKTAYTWLETLNECLNNNGKLPDVFPAGVWNLGGLRWSPLGKIANADLVAILCGKPEWITENTKKLEAKHLERSYMIFVNKLAIHLTHYPINEVIRLEPDEFRSTMEDYYQNKDPFVCVEEFDVETILHHPFFRSIREVDGFKDWWDEWNHLCPFVEPDPTFGVKDA